MIQIPAKLEWRLRRIGYYAACAGRELVPVSVSRWQRETLFRKLDRFGIDPDMRARVDYCNRLQGPVNMTDAPSIRSMQVRPSFYSNDFRRISRSFAHDFRARWIFADNIQSPDKPSFVKSRPIVGDNQNAMVMKLDSLRHFIWVADPVPFAAKAPRAVWRGHLNNPLRKALIDRYGQSTHHDVGHTARDVPDSPPKDHLSKARQLGFRYIISVEGYDVATNLKWIMSSNSLCLMPKPRYETWFMEGTLQAGVHYVELRDDFSDLDEQIAFYEANPEAAIDIISNANAYTRGFRNNADEMTVSLLVMQKYLELSDQVPSRFF